MGLYGALQVHPGMPLCQGTTTNNANDVGLLIGSYYMQLSLHKADMTLHEIWAPGGPISARTGAENAYGCTQQPTNQSGRCHGFTVDQVLSNVGHSC